MGDLDLAAVRAFVVVADNRHFGEAAAQLGVTQQAVSKRVAKLESDLGIVLFSRQRSGTRLSGDGAAFLPHARRLLSVAEQAAELAHRRRVPLRVDVLDTRLASNELVRQFHRTAPELELEVVTSVGLRVMRDTLRARVVHAAFTRAMGPLDQDGIASVPAYIEPLQLLANAAHPLGQWPQVPVSALAGTTVWMPGNVPGSEWADFYDTLAGEFAVNIDTSGPDFGYEHFVGRVSQDSDLLGFVGALTRVPHHPNVTRVPIVRPQPCYLWSLLWQPRTPHATLPGLVDHVRQAYSPPRSEADVWLPPADRMVSAGRESW